MFVATALTTATIANANIGQSIGLQDTDLVTVVYRVVQLALGYLPLIAVVFVILGGFQWLTSAGDEERLSRAKRTLSGAFIGLLIVLFAWAIVHYTAGTVLNVSNTNTGQ